MRMRKMVAVGLVAVICVGCQRIAERRSSFIETSKSTGLSAVRDFEAPSERMAYLKIAKGIAIPSQVFAAGKFLAVRHQLTVVERGAEVGKSLDAVVAFCGTIHCEVLNSNVANATEDAIPSASISVRVAPGDLGKFLEFVGKQGKVSQHSTETEDKTTQVVDLEAKLKNQAEFRDSLRKMLLRPGVSVADLLEIQEKLAEAQAELDSETAQRAVLANETEKVAVAVEFQAESSERRSSSWSPLGRAFRDAGREFAESFAALIIFVVAVIPWLILIVPCGWLLRRVWKNWRRRRGEAKATA